jgi:hypothetical protein
MEHDVSISHASEDKDAFVAELAACLRNAGLDVWYDDYIETLHIDKNHALALRRLTGLLPPPGVHRTSIHVATLESHGIASIALRIGPTCR